MPVAGDKITGAQYNAIQSTINTVLSTKYGQTLASSQLTIPATSTKITSGQWSNLRADLLKAHNHQNTTNGSLTQPTTSTVVSISDYNAYKTMADNCLTNFQQFDSGYSTLSSATTVNQAANTWGPAGASTLKITYTVTFASAAHAQYYFNAGGQIRFSAAAATGVGDGPPTNNTTKDYAWYSALNQMGTIVFDNTHTYTLAGATSPGTGSNIGYSNSQLLGQDNLIYTKSTTTYTPNQFKINYTPGASTLVFKVQFVDSNATTGFGIDEYISVQTSGYLRLYYASGTNQVDVSSYIPTITSTSGVISTPNP